MIKKLIFMSIFLITAFVNGQTIINSYVYADVCTPVAGDIFPTGNATSQCDGEANALGGWTNQNNSITTVIASDEADYNWAISIKTDNLANGYSRATYPIPVTSGVTYTVSITYKVPVADAGSNTEPRVDFWSGVVTSPSILFNTDGAIHTLTFDVTTNATTIGSRFYNAYVPPVDSANVELIIYNVTVS